jgi:ferredoxin
MGRDTLIGRTALRVKVKPLECTGCSLCEVACSFARDEAFSIISSSVMLYRVDEKKDYLGVMIKTDEDLFVGRPEGAAAIKLGDLQKQAGGGGASAKPILIREACDMCESAGLEPQCVAVCPRGALFIEEH